MRLVVAGPALVALGALRGRARCARAGGVLGARLGARRRPTSRRARSCPAPTTTSPAVAALLELARAPARAAGRGVRVLLVSTGSEESFMEGMRGFVARHGAALAARAHALRRARVASARPS